jgi:S-disulfanyl-L-cysteine oxidoreductase SoxD
MLPRRFLTLLPAAALLLHVAPAHAQSPTAEASARQGPYTAAQAERGEARFNRHCAECHTTREFTGTAFVRAWAGRRVFDFYDQVRTQMPAANPGSLSAQVYADIVAYVLRENGVPPGAAPLPADDEALKRVPMPAPDSTTR